MTGFRIGWAAGPKALIGAMNKVQDQSTSGPTSCAQWGALAALTGPQEPVAVMVKAFSERRDVIVAGLNAIPGVECPNPGGAFYAFPSIAAHLGKSYQGKTLATDTAISEVLLDHFGLAVVPGEPFGAPGFLRLSYATSLEEIRKGVQRLEKGLAALS
jgi:aspartate aminotransferase